MAMSGRLSWSVLLFGVISFSTLASELPKYTKQPGVAGNLSSVGSDTLSGMTTLWLEEFKNIYPNVNAQIQASGSSTALLLWPKVRHNSAL